MMELPYSSFFHFESGDIYAICGCNLSPPSLWKPASSKNSDTTHNIMNGFTNTHSFSLYALYFTLFVKCTDMSTFFQSRVIKHTIIKIMVCFIAIMALAFLQLMTYIWMFLIEAIYIFIDYNSITSTGFTPVKQRKNWTYAMSFLSDFNANDFFLFCACSFYLFIFAC